MPCSATGTDRKRAHFSNLAEVSEYIRAANDLPKWRRRLFITSLNCFARLYGRALIDMTARPKLYDDFIGRLDPREHGMTTQRWSDIRSGVRSTFLYIGKYGVAGRCPAVLTPVWKELYLKLPDPGSQWVGLSWLIRYASAQGIAPAEVDDDVAKDFTAVVLKLSRAKDPLHLVGIALRKWNECVDNVPGWPKRRLTLESRSRQWVIAWDDLSEPLRDEIDRWLSQVSAVDPATKNTRLKPLAPDTLYRTRREIRTLVSALAHRGVEPSSITSLRQLAEIDRLKIGLNELVTGSKGKNRRRWAFHAAATIANMARDWLELDQKHVATLKEICRNLASADNPLGEKVIRRLQQFDDEANIAKLFDFPQRRMARIKRTDDQLRQAAFDAQMAAVVELLIFVPLRRRALVVLELDRNFPDRQSPNGPTFLVVPEEHKGASVPVRVGLPEETSRLMRTYFDVYRPRLAAASNPFVFPSRGTRAKKGSIFSIQVHDAVLQDTGLHVSIDLFRHLAAKLYLEAHPDGHEVVRRVLGYRNLIPVFRFERALGSQRSVRRFDDRLLAG